MAIADEPLRFAARRARRAASWVAGAGMSACAAGLFVLAGWHAAAAGAAGLAAAACLIAWGAVRSAGAYASRRLLEPVSAPPVSAAASPALDQLAPFLEALPDPALLVDRDGRVAGSNRAARRQLAFEAAGLKLSSLLRYPELLDAATAAAHDGATRAVEYETNSQVEEHFRCYVAPVSWGFERAALLVFHDQTTQINIERMRADFLANASHELRTPLASLTLLIETLTGPARDDQAARERFLGMMAAQADRMRRLIDDLLSLSRIELNEHVPPFDRADLALVAREAIDALGPLARARGVRLLLEGQVDSIPVVGDRFQLLQVVQNLIDNAIKYSADGGAVEIEAGLAQGREEALERASRRWPDAARMSLLTPAPSARAYAYLRVTDSGVGIARRHLPRLGERFFRVERAEQAEQNGTGLGLAIVKHIMNRHRGGLTVESLPGGGSAFAVYVEHAPAVAPEGPREDLAVSR